MPQSVAQTLVKGEVLQKDLKKILMLPVYIAGLIIMGLASGYLTFVILSFSRTVAVPELKNKTLVEADNMLGKSGLHLKVEGENYDETVAPGLIAKQDIPPGNKVKEGRGISVILSKGPKIVSIPELTGQTMENAEAVISKSGLKIANTIRVHSDTIEKDVIISQRPGPEEFAQTEAVKDSQESKGFMQGLSFVVSSGPYDKIFMCPDFSGKNRGELMDLAENLGLKVEVTGAGEKVRHQKPPANSPVRSGDTLHIQM